MTFQRFSKNADKIFRVMILILLYTNTWLYSQDNNQHFKIGIEAGVGLFQPSDMNQLTDSWLNEQYDIVEVQGDISYRPQVNVSGFLGYSFIKHLELRLEMDYIESPPDFDIYNNDELSITITSCSPGISLNFNFDLFQFGCGIFRHFAKIKWEDKVFYYSDTWSGDNYGYHINAGLNLQLFSHFGFSSKILYRHLIIDELKNRNSQILRHIPEKRNFNLDLTGYEARLGIYFSF